MEGPNRTRARLDRERYVNDLIAHRVDANCLVIGTARECRVSRPHGPSESGGGDRPWSEILGVRSSR